MDICLQLISFVWSPALNIGTTFATLSFCGTIPKYAALLKIFDNRRLIQSAIFLSDVLESIMTT